MNGPERRICWPYPDCVCLQGGCGYCNFRPFRSLSSIRDYAASRGLLSVFEDGRGNGFFNAETRNLS